MTCLISVREKFLTYAKHLSHLVVNVIKYNVEEKVIQKNV